MIVSCGKGGRLCKVRFDTTAVVELLYKANPLYIAYSQSDIRPLTSEAFRCVVMMKELWHIAHAPPAEHGANGKK